MGLVDFRLIATDLDGTLLRSDGTVSRRTVDTLRAAEDYGYLVVAATGRPPRWMRPVADELGHTGVAVCANGAVVYDLHSDEVVEFDALVRSTVLTVSEIVRDAVPDAHFAVETLGGFGAEPGYLPYDDDLPYVTHKGPIDELAGDDVVKLLVRHDTMGPDDLLAQVKTLAGDLVEVTHSSKSALLEISATGVTKAATLARIAGRYGWQGEHAIAFGDMPNDLPMLAWAGAGYAMANAHPDVLAAAARRAPANDEDGVAHVVESYLPS